jgi:hypothetical protein
VCGGPYNSGFSSNVSAVKPSRSRYRREVIELIQGSPICDDEEFSVFYVI